VKGFVLFNTETPAPFRAPIGKWRVVEVEWLGGEEALSAIHAIHQDPNGLRIEYRRRGPLRAIIGDYDSFLEASIAVDRARPPWERVAFNDEGVRVYGFRPGDELVPKAGAES